MTGALHYIDLAIAFSLVMLLATTLVMTLAQIGATVLKQRRTILQHGLSALLAQAGLSAEQAAQVAADVMNHPAAQAGGGEAIQREQLVRILLDLAQSNPALKQALGANDPAQLLNDITTTATRLEQQYPHLATHVRQAQAILANVNHQANAAAAGVHKVMNGFDAAAEAMSSAMANKARIVTIALSFVVALLLPLDAIGILKKLSMDAGEVEQLVALAGKVKDSAPPAAPVSEDLNSLNRLVKSQVEQLVSPPLGIVALSANASTFGGWLDQWWKAVASPSAILGILLSTGLMSLGAPFWFDAIKNLFRLRPSVAQKESGERAERAAAQPAPLASVPSANPEPQRPDGQANGANAGG